MAVRTPEKESAGPAVVEGRGGKPTTTPAARLLAKVSKWNSKYADYQMDACVWRKLALKGR